MGFFAKSLFWVAIGIAISQSNGLKHIGGILQSDESTIRSDTSHETEDLSTIWACACKSDSSILEYTIEEMDPEATAFVIHDFETLTASYSVQQGETLLPSSVGVPKNASGSIIVVNLKQTVNKGAFALSWKCKYDPSAADSCSLNYFDQQSGRVEWGNFAKTSCHVGVFNIRKALVGYPVRFETTMTRECNWMINENCPKVSLCENRDAFMRPMTMMGSLAWAEYNTTSQDNLILVAKTPADYYSTGGDKFLVEWNTDTGMVEPPVSTAAPPSTPEPTTTTTTSGPTTTTTTPEPTTTTTTTTPEPTTTTTNTTPEPTTTTTTPEPTTTTTTPEPTTTTTTPEPTTTTTTPEPTTTTTTTTPEPTTTTTTTTSEPTTASAATTPEPSSPTYMTGCGGHADLTKDSALIIGFFSNASEYYDNNMMCSWDIKSSKENVNFCWSEQNMERNYDGFSVLCTKEDGSITYTKILASDSNTCKTFTNCTTLTYIFTSDGSVRASGCNTTLVQDGEPSIYSNRQTEHEKPNTDTGMMTFSDNTVLGTEKETTVLLSRPLSTSVRGNITCETVQEDACNCVSVPRYVSTQQYTGVPFGSWVNGGGATVNFDTREMPFCHFSWRGISDAANRGCTMSWANY